MKQPANNPFISSPEPDFKQIDHMNKEEAAKQVESLREAIEYHDYRYYVQNDPIISDKSYDALMDRLKQLEENFELQTENSPTQRVGAEPIESLDTRRHVSEMLSLNSSEEVSRVKDFGERVTKEVGDVTFHCEPKFDGISVEFVYRDGELEAAVTRGNGVKGEDITQNIRTIPTVPLQIPTSEDELVVRGEVYIPKDGFQRLNRERIERGDEPFANPRNAAAGTVRQLDSNIVARRPLNVYFYDLMESSLNLESQTEVMEALKELGFKVNDYNEAVNSIEDFVYYRDKMMELRDELNYDIDGVVAKINSFDKRDKLGSTAAHPRWAFAYKFPAKTEITNVADIAVQVGRTGKITPVALLEPVVVQGVTISRASLHNEKQVHELGVSSGAKVRVERAGDVIPQIAEVIERGSGKFEMPDECPACGSKVIKEKENHFCTGGVTCPAQLKRKIEYFASEEALDIQGLGEKVAVQLVEQGIIDTLPDIYRLEKSDLLELERFSDKSAEKLIEEIEKSKDTDLAEFITALGIYHVGKEISRKLAENFSLEELVAASREDLAMIDGIGDEIAESINRFFSEGGKELVNELREEGVKPHQIKSGDKLRGLKLVITGSIEGYTRNELTDLLESNGADVTSSVSSETDYLIMGDNPGEKKIEGAEKKEIEILDERQFRAEVLSRL